ncbi:MAG: FAD binding domain-containing protein [Pseudomonadota bacterium]
MSRIIVNGTAHPIPPGAADRNLLNWLRETQGLTGTKEGCASGDCGACTVLVHATEGADLDHGQRYFVINSCITPLAALAGREVITVEGLGDPKAPHPVQAAMATEHASQCGYCTPGFVMALAAQQLDTSPFPEDDAAAHEAAVRSISGNLCRCTGYRPILAALEVANETIARSFEGNAEAALPPRTESPGRSRSTDPNYLVPTTLVELHSAIRSAGSDPTFVAGATDLWLECNQRYQDFEQLIDLSQVDELNDIERADGWLSIGAAVSHRRLARLFSGQHELGADLFAPAVLHLLERFGSPQVRNRGTLGGNLGTASPIADWPPLLLCLDAELILGSVAGERRVPLDAYYTGYRQTVRQPGEYLKRIELREPHDWRAPLAFKVSKRTDDDISSVFGAFYLRAERGQVTHCRLAYGGVAATPWQPSKLAKELLGAPTTEATLALALRSLEAEVQPLDDVRASRAYRQAMTLSLFRRAWAAMLSAPGFADDLYELAPVQGARA